ncbi:MAG: hypothetical protein D6744_18535 [Planctomycetota bacterium]|nr:MAG: hypothetical protein D6744_18535 [Planctomycetota bacterium]
MKKLAATLMMGLGVTTLAGCDDYEVSLGFLDPLYGVGYSSFYEPATYIVEDVYTEDVVYYDDYYYDDTYYYDDYYYEETYYDDGFWFWP